MGSPARVWSAVHGSVASAPAPQMWQVMAVARMIAAWCRYWLRYNVGRSCISQYTARTWSRPQSRHGMGKRRGLLESRLLTAFRYGDAVAVLLLVECGDQIVDE